MAQEVDEINLTPQELQVLSELDRYELSLLSYGHSHTAKM